MYGRPLNNGAGVIARKEENEMKNTAKYLLLAILPLLLCSWQTVAQGNKKNKGGEIKFNSYNGLVMTGYQGWFNAPDDGAGLGWKHYKKGDDFTPGNCTIDLWPDVSEYKKTYKTEFVHGDGRPAYVFSSYDKSTTDLHFSWMKEYGIDGAFMQRFVTSIRSEKGAANYDAIINNAADAAEKYGRAFCVMYDLSGIKSGEEQILMDDWKKLSRRYKITSRKNNHYLHHNGKPLVAVWGIGFNDNRKYGYDDIRRIIEFLKAEGCSILVGVPAHWRTLQMDAMADPQLHEIIMQADIIHPWFVGRYNRSSYPHFQKLIKEDVAWCEKNGKDYAPVLFPGFSWYNLQGGVAAPVDQIPREGGRFFWDQAAGALEAGAKCFYLAMFDEIDEGTAFFKCTNDPPAGASPFLTYHGLEPDHYLWLASEAGRMLRGEMPLSADMPERKR